MHPYPKTIKKLLREWAGIAYQRELEAEIEKLYWQFQQWKDGTLNPFDLSDEIHKFHQDAARDLYVRYNMSGSIQDLLIVGAIANGIISKEELPNELLLALEPALTIRELH